MRVDEVEDKSIEKIIWQLTAQPSMIEKDWLRDDDIEEYRYLIQPVPRELKTIIHAIVKRKEFEEWLLVNYTTGVGNHKKYTPYAVLDGGRGLAGLLKSKHYNNCIKYNI